MRYGLFSNNILVSFVDAEEKPTNDWTELPDDIPTTHIINDNGKLRAMTDKEIDGWKEPAALSSLLTDIRFKRDQLLTQSDWIENASVRKGKGDAWALSWDTYRQALRDLPSSITSSKQELIWPQPPV